MIRPVAAAFLSVGVFTLAVPSAAQEGGTTLAAPVAAQDQGVSFPLARVAFFDAQRVATESSVGQAAFAELEAFQSRTAAELQRRNEALATERRRLQAQAGVLSPDARLDLEDRIRRAQLDIERMLEDAQAEFLGLQQQVETGFQVRLTPVVAEVVGELGVHFLFERRASPLAWADPAYDLTDQIIERLDAN